MTYAVTVAPDARYSQPYWKLNPKVDRYDIEIPEHHTLPWSPPDVMAEVRYTSAGVEGHDRAARPLQVRGPWVGGEKQKVVNIVPALSVAVSPGIAMIPQRRAARSGSSA
jgi:hypothetical protein